MEELTISIAEEQMRAEIDMQINTAKKFPRNLSRCKENAIAVATANREIAESCIYSIPRAGKIVQGLSTHAARIIAREFTNLRVASRIISIDDTMLTAQAVCHDLETNYAELIEVKRKITDRSGQRYNDDMIITTANAALAIASRNAILRVVNHDIIDAVYKAVNNMVIGHLDTDEQLIRKRAEVLRMYKEKLNVDEQKILDLLNLSSVSLINADHLASLIGIATAIRDQEITVQQIFGDDGKSVEIKKKIDEILARKKK